MTTTEDPQQPDFVGPVSNDAESDISVPYTVNVKIQGTSTLLFHAWSNEAVASKAAAKKGSEAKKTDNVESYVYRDDKGHICLPGQYLVGSLTDKSNGAAKSLQDPRSPRKSALDLFRAGVVALTELAPITAAEAKGPSKNWDFLDSRRAVVQRSGITRTRPAFHPGWQAQIQLGVLVPEYISPNDLLLCLNRAGLLTGVGDFRPTYGRFQVINFDVGLTK